VKKLLFAFVVILCCCIITFTVFGAETLSEEDAEHYLAYVPLSAYRGNSTVNDVLADTSPMAGVERPLFKELIHVGLLPKDYKFISPYPTEEQMKTFPKISYEDLKATVDRMFGAGTFDKIPRKDFFEVDGLEVDTLALHYLEDENAYAYFGCSYRSGYGGPYYTNLLRYETVGDDVVLYSVHAEYGYFYDSPSGKDNFVLYDVSGYYSYGDNASPAIGTFDFADSQERDLLKVKLEVGRADGYLPVYKHVFKKNADGSYRWERTDLESSGKLIPPEILDAKLFTDTPSDVQRRVPLAAYSGGDETVSSLALDGSVVKVLIDELRGQSLISDRVLTLDKAPSEKDKLTSPKVSAEYMAKIFDRLFGTGASAILKGKTVLQAGQEYLYLLEDGKTYAYVSYGGALDSEASARRIQFVRSEKVGEDLAVYVRYARYAPFVPGEGRELWFYGAEEGAENAACLMEKIDVSDLGSNLWTKIESGKLDDYFPVYKHTFKSNGDGTYAWIKTELDTAGKEISPSVLSASSVPEETPGNPATDTSAPTDGAAEEASFPWVWVYIGGAAVIVALGAIFLLKKKKT